MRKHPSDSKGEATRRRIFEIALTQFRKKGFDATTMRGIAAAAGLSVGAAYHYFPSKEAIVLAYYAQLQDATATAVRPLFAKTTDLHERLSAVMHARITQSRRDRRLFATLFRTVIDPDHPLSVFAQETRAVRDASIAIFAEALGDALPAETRPLMARSLWLLHLGFLLYFIHDRSPRQKRTEDLINGTLDLLVPLMQLTGVPGMRLVRSQLISLLIAAELIPSE